MIADYNYSVAADRLAMSQCIFTMFRWPEIPDDLRSEQVLYKALRLGADIYAVERFGGRVDVYPFKSGTSKLLVWREGVLIAGGICSPVSGVWEAPDHPQRYIGAWPSVRSAMHFLPEVLTSELPEMLGVNDAITYGQIVLRGVCDGTSVRFHPQELLIL